MNHNSSPNNSLSSSRFDEVLSEVDLVDCETSYRVQKFLYREARLLDQRRFEEWVSLFSDDAVYEAPMRLTRETGSTPDISQFGRIFSETKSTLEIRIQRLRTEFAWAEQPPSRTRHFVTNVMCYRIDDSLRVRSNLLVYRNRGESPSFDLYSADRDDVIITAPSGEFQIRSRWIVLDQSNVTGNSMSIFL